MIELVKDIQLRIEVAQFLELDENWKTSCFEKHLSIIPFTRLYFPVEGEGYVAFNNKKLHLRPGFLYLIPPFVSTEVYCPRRMVKYWTHFNACLFNSEIDIFSIGDVDYEIPAADSEKIISLFQILVRSCQAPRSCRKFPVPPMRQIECHAALTLLLIPFYEKLIKANDPQSEVNERFLKLLHHVETHLSESLTLKELAHEVHLNPTYLSNMFARKMGMPLIQYCNNRRIARAVNMLHNTDYSIEDIALQLGAESTAAFSRLFKRRVGVSPRIYRQKVKSGLEID